MIKEGASQRATVAAIELEIQRVRSLGREDLRSLWGGTFKRDVPKALTRDLLVRMLAWYIQEQAFGGHDRATLKILDSYVKGTPADAQMTRRLKAGTEIVREYQGERHTVVVTAGGFRWRDGDYPSLTAIARIITGTICNGPPSLAFEYLAKGRALGPADRGHRAGKSLLRVIKDQGGPSMTIPHKLARCAIYGR